MSRVVRLPLLDDASVVREGPVPEASLLQVGELARQVGKTVRAIHHYEELGLLKPDARSRGRFRLYDPTAVVRVRWIAKLHDLGMSLSEIRAMADQWGSAATPKRAMSQVRRMYQQKLEETRAQIAHLAGLERELAASIEYLDTCDSCEPPTVEPVAQPALATEPCEACQRREREAEPDLVAGIPRTNVA